MFLNQDPLVYTLKFKYAGIRCSLNVFIVATVADAVVDVVWSLDIDDSVTKIIVSVHLVLPYFE